MKHLCFCEYKFYSNKFTNMGVPLYLKKFKFYYNENNN